MAERVLTDEERKAIASLQRLAARWPSSLKLFSANGTLCVIPNNTIDYDRFEDFVLETVPGIPNDGGDPW